MRSLTLIAGALLLLVAAGPSARASVLWDYSYSASVDGKLDTGNGYLLTSNYDSVLGGYLIRNMSGTRTYDGVTYSVTMLLDTGMYGSNDNILYDGTATGVWLTGNGFSFTAANGGSIWTINLFYDGGYALWSTDPTLFERKSDAIGTNTFQASVATPEPASVALIACGLLSLTLLRRRAS